MNKSNDEKKNQAGLRFKPEFFLDSLQIDFSPIFEAAFKDSL